MTSEIAVMNRQAIALAADSAVTFARGPEQKVFPSANKIFTLSKYQPVGVMVYGNADFMEIPWETIIKIFRSRLGTDSFKTVSSYATHFLDFLRQSDLLFSDSEIEQLTYVDRSVRWYLGGIRERYNTQVAVALVEKGKIDQEFSKDLITKIIHQESDQWNQADTAPNAPANFADEFIGGNREQINEAMDDILGGIPLSDESLGQLMEVLVNLFLKFPAHVHIPASSGVVFAGFGTDDVFPVLESYTVEGRIGDYLKHRRDEKNCAVIGGSESAVVRPFAQREMVDTFMSGIDPEYRILIDGLIDSLGEFGQQLTLEYIADICSAPYEDEDDEWFDPEYRRELVESLESYWTEIREAVDFSMELRLSEFQESFSKYSHQWHISPILSVVQGLPKDELAAMAESLINLTSFKRRVSMQAETVGGPIDVAVISKGDGFVWIKRKHYFEREVNPQFFDNYYR